MDEGIANFLFRIGSEIANEAKAVAPYKTGNLKRDIQVFDVDVSDLSVKIGNSKTAFYAPFVHEGTGRNARDRNKSKNPNRGGVKANPYIETGLDNYIGSGGFDRAKEALAKKMSTDINRDIKDMFRDIK